MALFNAMSKAYYSFLDVQIDVFSIQLWTGFELHIPLIGEKPIGGT